MTCDAQKTIDSLRHTFYNHQCQLDGLVRAQEFLADRVLVLPPENSILGFVQSVEGGEGVLRTELGKTSVRRRLVCQIEAMCDQMDAIGASCVRKGGRGGRMEMALLFLRSIERTRELETAMLEYLHYHLVGIYGDSLHTAKVALASVIANSSEGITMDELRMGPGPSESKSE